MISTAHDSTNDISRRAVLRVSGTLNKEESTASSDSLAWSQQSSSTHHGTQANVKAQSDRSACRPHHGVNPIAATHAFGVHKTRPPTLSSHLWHHQVHPQETQAEPLSPAYQHQLKHTHTTSTHPLAQSKPNAATCSTSSRLCKLPKVAAKVQLV